MRDNGKTYLYMSMRNLAQLGAYLFTAAVFIFSVWAIDNRAEAQKARDDKQDRQEFITTCHTANEIRGTIRTMVKSVLMASTEALISVAGNPENQTQVDAYRQETVRRGEEIANELPDRDCPTELRQYDEEH